MAFHEILLPWDSQPQEAVELNLDHPLAASVRLALPNGGHAFEVAGSRLLPLGSSASFTPAPIGIQQQFSGAAVAGTQLAGGAGFSSLVPVISGALGVFWLVAQVRVTATGARRVILGDWAAPGNAASIYLERSSGGNLNFGVYSGGTAYGTGLTGLAEGWHSIAAWVDAENNIGILANALPAQQAAGASVTRAAGVDLRLGSAGAYVDLPFNGGVGAIIIGQGFPGESALRALANNPWQIFRQRIPVPVAATGATPTLSAATYVPGSITSSGFTPRITITF